MVRYKLTYITISNWNLSIFSWLCVISSIRSTEKTKQPPLYKLSKKTPNKTKQNKMLKETTKKHTHNSTEEKKTHILIFDLVYFGQMPLKTALHSHNEPWKCTESLPDHWHRASSSLLVWYILILSIHSHSNTLTLTYECKLYRNSMFLLSIKYECVVHSVCIENSLPMPFFKHVHFIFNWILLQLQWNSIHSFIISIIIAMAMAHGYK